MKKSFLSRTLVEMIFISPITALTLTNTKLIFSNKKMKGHYFEPDNLSLRRRKPRAKRPSQKRYLSKSTGNYVQRQSLTSFSTFIPSLSPATCTTPTAKTPNHNLELWSLPLSCSTTVPRDKSKRNVTLFKSPNKSKRDTRSSSTTAGKTTPNSCFIMAASLTSSFKTSKISISKRLSLTVLAGRRTKCQCQLRKFSNKENHLRKDTIKRIRKKQFERTFKTLIFENVHFSFYTRHNEYCFRSSL